MFCVEMYGRFCTRGNAGIQIPDTLCIKTPFQFLIKGCSYSCMMSIFVYIDGHLDTMVVCCPFPETTGIAVPNYLR